MKSIAIGFQRGQALADRPPPAWQNRGSSGIIRFGGSKSRLPELRLDHVQRLWVTQVEPTTILRRKEVIHRHGGQDTHMLRLRGQFHLHCQRTGDVRVQGLHQRAQTMPHLPRIKESIPRELRRWRWDETQAPDVSHHLRPVRQGNSGAVPTQRRSSSLLQRLLQQDATGGQSVDADSECEKGLVLNPAPFDSGGNPESPRLPISPDSGRMRVAMLSPN